jgi:hypothetical protein
MTQIRRNPGAKARATSTTPLADTQSTVLHGHDRVEPLDADDRSDLAVLEAAAERGYRLSTQCTACGLWLTSRKSLLAHMGPKCRAKAVAK